MRPEPRIGAIEVLSIGDKGASRERHRLFVGLCNNDMPRRADQRIVPQETRIFLLAPCLPDLPILVDHLACSASQAVHALLRRTLQIAGIPEPRTPLLHL